MATIRASNNRYNNKDKRINTTYLEYLLVIIASSPIRLYWQEWAKHQQAQERARVLRVSNGAKMIQRVEMRPGPGRGPAKIERDPLDLPRRRS